jgi:ABC-type lipoprotein export system ATPase subunit
MFQLNNVIPIPLKEQGIAASEVWQTEFKLDVRKRYFVQAPSGKGKTTFQLLLYGIRKDYEGEAMLETKDGWVNLRALSLDDWAKLRQNRLAIIFQDLRLFPQLTVEENLILKNDLTQHMPIDEIKAMAERLGVAFLWNKQAGILSYGQRQRVAIIRALSQPFDFLLMDEPFAHLDQENIKKACDLIMEVCAKQEAGYMIASLGERYQLVYDQEIQL